MEDRPRFTGIAIMGLFFITAGIIMVFAFIASVTGANLPEFLEFRSESYSMLMMGIVNIAAAIGLLYRHKSMWSITVVFIVIIMAGDLMDIFFTGNMKIAVFIAYLAVVMYLLTKEARVWYNAD